MFLPIFPLAQTIAAPPTQQQLLIQPETTPTGKRTRFTATAPQQSTENRDAAPASAGFAGTTRQHPGFQ
ncbi:MAG: hypothetical protein ACM65M_02075 [Microcoleus sp.]